MPTSLLTRCFLLGALLSVLLAPATAQTLSQRVQSPQKEPYHVLYSINSEGQVVGNNVWVPVEFADLLNQNTKYDSTAVSQRWHVCKAVYQGSLTRGISGRIECSDDFKAVYDIYLDSPNATVTLPRLPVIQGKAYWNAKPIWQNVSNDDTLTFLLENEVPGKHTLEIALLPEEFLQNSGETYQIAFPIPKVPDSTLFLNIPPDMQQSNIPAVKVPDALGSVTVDNTLLTAELGAVEQLSLSWVDDPNRVGTLMPNVEQFFWIRVRPSQVELNALFRFRIEGGTIQRLTIQTDPRWGPSGQFSCVEQHPFTQRIEINSELPALGGTRNVTVIDFQSPVSGTVTLRADFVHRDFDATINAIGNIQLPEFRVLYAHSTRAMLGISAEPTLELNFPAEGRSSGFESGWEGTSGIASSFFEDNPFWRNITSALLSRRNGSAPDVAYDLTKTESDWTLNIRAKKTIPKVAVSQSIQFDVGESKFLVNGEFTSDTNVFRQYFSADQTIHIDSIEVRGPGNELIDAHWQQITSEAMPEEYLIFYRQPVIGKYTVSIRGSFTESPVGENTEEKSSRQPVPVLTFGDVQTTGHALHLFRTPAVIAEISSEQSCWTQTSAIPTVPEAFARSAPLGTWLNVSHIEQVQSENEEQNESMLFTLSPNRPKMQCKTNLSLQADADDNWTMIIDFDSIITDGELKSLSFRWDERCSIILPVEPATFWNIEQSGGLQMLTLFPTEPMSGKQHFTIPVTLSTSGTPFLPNVFPLAGNVEHFESEVFVKLPHEQNDEIIPWELNHLEEVQGDVDEHLFYRAMNTNFSATVSQIEARLIAVFYDIGFLIKRDGTVIGSATIDLRNRGQNHFVLQMPMEYELLQISSADLILERTQLEEENRWRVNIGTSDYPQRLNVLFRTLLRQPITQWNRTPILSVMQFPFLEGVTVQDTIWTVVLEGNVSGLNIDFVLEEHENMGKHVPVSGRDAALSLIGLNLIRERNLLRLLNSLPVSARQEDEMRRWFSHWLEEWNTVADKVDFQVANLSLMSQNVTPRLIFRSVDSTTDREETQGIVRPFLRTMSAVSWQALRDLKEESVKERFGISTETPNRQHTPILSSQVYWQGRISGEMQYLFGTEEGVIRAVRLSSVPTEERWATTLFSEHIWLWISLTLLIPIIVLLSVRRVYLMGLWLQFPHFWGMTLGVLFWTLLPESFIGLILIILTIASFFRPSWNRRQFVPKPF